MGTLSGGGATVAQIWDELIANARVAGSLGQRLKDAVGLDTLTAARMIDVSKISSVAVAAGDAANSIAQKVRGMTDNQLVASSGLALTFNNSRVTLTANQSEEIIPAAGATHTGTYATDTGIGTTDFIQLSANSGTNYSNANVVQVETGFSNAANDVFYIVGIGNSTGRYKYVASATVGSRIFIRCITIMS